MDSTAIQSKKNRIFATHVQWQREVGVETSEEDEEGRDEVVDGGGARVRRQRDRNQVDHRHDGPTQILKRGVKLATVFLLNFRD